MKFKLTQRQQAKQKQKMSARLVFTAAVFAFFAVTVALTFIFNIGDVRRMFAQTDSVDRYWVGNATYTSPFSNQWEVDAWELSNDNGTGSWLLSGNGTATITVDDASGGYASSLKHSYNGAPVLLTLDKVAGRLDLNVTDITGGRTVFSVDAEQYDANNTYLSSIRVMYPAAYSGYFVTLFSDISTWDANATKVRFVINVDNQSTTQGTMSFNQFTYSSGNNDWKNPQNWATATGATGGESVPTGTDNAIFDGAYTSNCNINGSLNVGGILLGSAYPGMLIQNANPITVGTSGITLNNGTFQGGSGAITVNGPITIAGASATFKSTSADLTLGSDFTLTSGTFTHNSGRVVINNDMTWTGTASLYDMSITAASGTKTFNFATGTTVTVNNTFALDGAGTLFMNGAGTIAAKSNITLANTGLNGGGTATILVNGTGAQTLTGNSTIAQGRLPKLTIDKASGSLAITNTVSVGGDFTYVKGTTTVTGSTLAFGGSDLNIDAQGTSATLALNNVVVDKSIATTAGDFTVGGTLDVSSTATLQLAGFSTAIAGTTTAYGTIKTTSATGNKTLSNLIVNATGKWDCSAVDEEFNITGNIENYGTFLASNSTGTNTMYYLLGTSKYLKGNLSIPRVEIDNSGNTASYTNYDTLNVSTSLRGAGGTLIQNTNAYLRLGILPNASDMSLTTLNASAVGNTVNYNLGTNQTQNVYATTYHHIIFSGDGTKNLIGGLTVNGDLSIKNTAILDVSASNYLINIKGNWVNSSLPGSSLAPFNARTGTVTFTGTATQSISSSAYAGGNSFYNLTFNNTSTTIPQITMSNSDNATGTLTLTSGHIDLVGNTFTLGSSPTVKGTLSYTSGLFLSGTFKRWFSTTAVAIGNVAGQLPVGHKESASAVADRSAYVGGTPTTGGTVAARHQNATGNNDFPVPFDDNGALVDVRHNMSWIMSSGDGLDGTNFLLRLQAQNIPGVNNSAALRIVKQNGIAPGTSLAGSGSNTNPVANKQGMVPSNMNNTFYIGSAWNTNPLPISLLAFTAVPDGNRVKLDWVTASEENNDYFTIERSKNGVDYDIVLTKPGAGNSNTTITYQDYDNSPLPGTSYYRLKQTDYNGQFKYSSPVSVQFNQDNQDIEFNVFPNPASAAFGDAVQFTLNTTDMDEQPVLINILDMSGKIVSSKSIRSNRSILQAELVQASELKAGIYTAVVVIGKKQIVKKLIIQ